MVEPERNSRCGRWLLVNTTDEGKTAFPMRCRRWACPRCGLAMRNRLVHLIEQSHPTTFVTLTCNPRLYPTPEDAFHDLSGKFADLIKRLRRRYQDAELEYIAVWERTSRGWPHLHVLLRAPFIPWQILSAIWAELTGAPVIDIRAVGSTHAAGRYVAKYLTKSGADYIPGRRWRASAGFLPEPFRPTKDRPATVGSWKVWRGDVLELLHDWGRAGYIIDSGDAEVIHARPRTARDPDPLLSVAAAMSRVLQARWRRLAFDTGPPTPT